MVEKLGWLWVLKKQDIPHYRRSNKSRCGCMLELLDRLGRTSERGVLKPLMAEKHGITSYSPIIKQVSPI
jgi:hypothetical protein